MIALGLLRAFFYSTLMRPAVVLALTLLTTTLPAQENPLWLRQPAISPDGSIIVFCYQGDLWRVPAAGGDAVLLTTHDAVDAGPVWSHDGKLIAFTSNRYGNYDVFVMPSGGGQATRLKALNIGKLVGMPVPGTGTAVWWEGLQNEIVFGIPQVGMVDNNGNYLENQQLEPDVKVANEPGPMSMGRDQQLEAAVKALLAR